MRERGVQSRRVRAGKVEPVRRPGHPTRGGGNFWQVLAIVALVAATAGWTTVAVLALREPSPAAVESPSESFDPNATEDPTVPPVAETHDAPELEALLPRELNGTALQIQSWDGEGFLTDDAWSTSMTSFLTSAGKAPTDLHVAQAYDPSQVLDGSVGVYRVAGVEAAALRDALVAAWKGDYPDMKVSQVTLGGRDVTKGDFGEDTIRSYLYLRDDLVYDIETTDETIAIAAFAALPEPGASGAPASGAPASGAPASAAPSGSSGSPAASPSPS